MLGLENPIHLLFVLLVVLLLFGAKRLPEMGKSLGTGLRGFKDSLNGDATLSEAAPVEVPAPAIQAAPHGDAAVRTGAGQTSVPVAG